MLRLLLSLELVASCVFLAATDSANSMPEYRARKFARSENRNCRFCQVVYLQLKLTRLTPVSD